MPVTRSRTYLSDIGLEDSNNTTGFLFGDEDSNPNETRTTPTAQANNSDAFPSSLFRQQAYPNMVSLCSVFVCLCVQAWSRPLRAFQVVEIQLPRDFATLGLFRTLSSFEKPRQNFCSDKLVQHLVGGPILGGKSRPTLSSTCTFTAYLFAFLSYPSTPTHLHHQIPIITTSLHLAAILHRLFVCTKIRFLLYIFTFAACAEIFMSQIPRVT